MANFNLEQIFKKSGAKINHSVFDVSKRMAFSLPCSYVTPIYEHPCTPNEHHKISLAGLMRTETMNTAAFVNGKVHVNFFFVPYSQLWHPFNSFVSQKPDKHSVRYQHNGYAPNISLRYVLEWVRDLSQKPLKGEESQYYDDFGYNLFFHACRILQVFGYGNYYWFWNHALPEIQGYLDRLFDKQTPSSQESYYAKERYVNLWPILAYQHIFYDYYRNKFYDTRTFDGREYVETFNVDNVVCSTVDTSHFVPSVQLMASLFRVHNVQYKKDLFTSLMPSTQFGPVSNVEFDTLDLSNVPSDARLLTVGEGGLFTSDGLQVQNTSSFDISQAANNKFQNVDPSFDTQAFVGNGKASFDVLSMRRSELLQRWKQNALRAGNMVDDNFESHYGVKPFYEEDNNVLFLGSFSCELNVNPVTATATTDNVVNGKVGDLAAIGVGSFHGEEIDFQCRDFGVIIGVAAFLPDVYYNANGLKQENTLVEPFDYPYPEFMNTGFEPVPFWRSSLENAQIPGQFPVDNVLGFSSPYNYLKTNVDEVYDEFSNFQYSLNNKWIGSLSSWIFKRRNNVRLGADNVQRTMKSNVYVDPNTTDAVFGVEYDGSASTNPFLFSVTVNHSAIRPYSVLGLPEF